jgi:cytidyltransferase-like protein
MTSWAITVGCFDLLHEGHANLFDRMREYGEPVVLVHDDRSIWQNKGRMPAQPLPLRVRNLTLAGIPSHAIYRVPTADPSRSIRRVAGLLDGGIVYVRGDDWPEFPGRSEVEALGIPIKLIPYTDGVSSSTLRSKP